MRRIALGIAATAALVMPSAPAEAAETAYVAAGVLTYTSAVGQTDAVTVGDGMGPYFGKHFLNESASPSGGPGAGCVPVSGETYVICTGATSVDIDTLDGDDFAYVMSNLPSTIDGGAGADQIWGGPAADTITGGADADDIRGGDGDDRIYAQDGAVDTIDCGTGDDRAYADADDIVTNCEPEPVVDPIIETTPLEQPKTETPKLLDAPKADEPKPAVETDRAPRAIEDPLPPVSPVSLLAGEVKVAKGGIAPIELGCAATEIAGCSGDVFLDPVTKKAKGKAKGKGRSKGKVRAFAARRGRFGKSPFHIAAGKKKHLKVQLTAEAKRKLGLPVGKRARAARRGRRVKAVVTVVQRGKKATTSVIELRG